MLGIVLHEILHGLGFLSLVDSSTGEVLQNRNDIFMTFLEDHTTGLTWGNMTDNQRANSATDGHTVPKTEVGPKSNYWKEEQKLGYF